MRWKVLVLIVFMIILFLVPYKYLLVIYAKNLRIEKKLKQSDIVVILGGNPTYRTDKAIELYRSGYSKKVIIIKTLQLINPKYADIDLSNDLISIKILKQHRVPYIKLSPTKSVGSTMEEALVIKEYIVRNKIKSITIITDNFHTYRAYNIFKYIFNKSNLNVKLGVIPTDNNLFNEENWFDYSYGLSAYILELLKLLKYEYIKIKNYI